MEMDPLAWAVILLIAGLILVVVEFFVPSSGVLGVSAFACLVFSVVLAFRHSQLTGLLFMGGAVLGAPVMLAMGVKFWPHTPIGRRILINNPRPEDVLPDTPLRRE